MGPNRREFLGFLTASAALTAGTTAYGNASPNQPHAFDWPGIRDAFDFDDNHVPMNAANLCPSSRRVAEAVRHYTAMIDADCSFQNRDRFSALTEASRIAVATPLGISVDEIALVRNTSEANNIVNAGLDLVDGDEVVVWEQNHPSNHVAWKIRARRTGMRVVTVSVPEDPTSLDELIEPFRRAITPRTRVLTVTHISNVSGLRLPVEELGSLCRQRGIHFHIDGAQTWGALDIDLNALGCDSFSASAHKWFVGPKEVGLLYVREEAAERLWPGVASYGWGDDAQTDLVGARKFESLGQRDDAALAAVAEAAAMHGDLGAAHIQAHMVALATRLKAGLIDAGVPLLTPMEPAFSAGVCIAKVNAPVGAALWEGLYREYGIIAAPTGGLRLCPHLYNTTEHVDRAIAGVRALLRV